MDHTTQCSIPLFRQSRFYTRAIATMSIRRCTEKDADAVAELCARGKTLNSPDDSGPWGMAVDKDNLACSDDPLLGDMMHPWRKEYPDDFVAYFRRKFMKTIGHDSHHHVVTIEVGKGQKIVTGYADWLRRHAGDEDKLAGTTNTGSYFPINDAVAPQLTHNTQTAIRIVPPTGHTQTSSNEELPSHSITGRVPVPRPGTWTFSWSTLHTSAKVWVVNSCAMGRRLPTRTVFLPVSLLQRQATCYTYPVAFKLWVACKREKGTLCVMRRVVASCSMSRLLAVSKVDVRYDAAHSQIPRPLPLPAGLVWTTLRHLGSFYVGSVPANDLLYACKPKSLIRDKKRTNQRKPPCIPSRVAGAG